MIVRLPRLATSRGINKFALSFSLPLIRAREALRDIWPLPTLILVVLGGIFTGVFSPTEAGALGAFAAAVIALARRKLTWRTFVEAVSQAMISTASIFIILIGSLFFTRFLALSGSGELIAQAVIGLQADPLMLILGISALYLFLGMFLDPIGAMLLTLPVFLPAFDALDMNLIWVGVIVVKMIEVGLLTPPVGLNVYVVKNVAGDSVPLQTVFKGVLWFLGCEVIIMALLIAFPGISLWLPSLMHMG